MREASQFQMVQEKLRDLIVSGELAENGKLPSERVLAERFKVSRNSVREAIRVLNEQGVLDRRRGDGTYIRSASRDRLQQMLEEALSVNRRRLREIMEFRRMLEPGITALAARNATPRDLEQLKVLVCDQQRRILSGMDDADVDAAFHLQLAKAAQNEVLVSVLAAVNDIIAESRSAPLRDPRRKKVSQETHLRIVDALEKRDAEMARRIMEEHLRVVEQEVMRVETERNKER